MRPFVDVKKKASSRWVRASVLGAFAASALAIGVRTSVADDDDVVVFDLVPNAKFVPCLAAHPGMTPVARAGVIRGKLNDTLILDLQGFKENLAFDLFTVESSPFKADGTADPAFKNFGLAWYQSDVQVREDHHSGRVRIKTILLDQIFGFDPNVNLPPTNTFHVGFWFNDPKDAEACGFDVTKPTPFNGEHKAGPLAFITSPRAETGLGPLCANPDFSTNPVRCNP